MPTWVCFDLDEAAKFFGARRGTPEYDERGWIFDVNEDGLIDVYDLAWFARRYGVATKPRIFWVSLGAMVLGLVMILPQIKA